MAIVWQRLAVAGLCILLVAGGLLLAHRAGPATGPPDSTRHWVRARDGWQIARWERVEPTRHPALHPGLLAAFIALTSVTALMAFSAPAKNTDASGPNSPGPTG